MSPSIEQAARALEQSETFHPGDKVLLPGIVQDVREVSPGRQILVVDIQRGDGMSVRVTCGHRVPEKKA